MFEKFPPRLPEQPIFYPVLNIKYARFIASNWNTKDANSLYIGYVLEFEVNNSFLKNYEIQTVGSEIHKEYWILSDDLEHFNSNIIGKIKVVEKYDKFYKLDNIYNMPILETNRLILRPMNLSDKEDVHEYASDKETTRYMLFNTHTDIEQTKEHINFLMSKYDKS